MGISEKQGIGGRDMAYRNGVEGGCFIVSPWGKNIAVTATGETVIITREDFRQIVDWLDSWGYLDYGNPI